MFAWSSWKNVFPLVLGVTGMLGWIAYSYFWSDEPMIPVQVLNNRTSSISYASNVVQGIAVSCLARWRGQKLTRCSNSECSTTCHCTTRLSWGTRHSCLEWDW